jgi:hypothetical protein
VTTFEERKAEIEAEYHRVLEETSRMEDAAYEKRERDLAEAMLTHRPPNAALDLLKSGVRIYETYMYEYDPVLRVVDASNNELDLPDELQADLELASSAGLVEYVVSPDLYDYAYVLTETGKRYAAGADAESGEILHQQI